MKRLFRRPSPAMVVAIVALIAALGGTAVGAAFVTKKQSKKIAANQVNKLAPGLSVASAKSADNANALGGTAANGFPQVTQFAYGEIASNASVNGSVPSRGIVASVPGPITGVYCLDLAFTPTFAEGSPTGASGGLLNVLPDIPATNCNTALPSADATVYLINSNTGAFVNDDFQVLFGGF
jgi:hypothetical protein